MKVRDIMTTDVISITENSPIEDAARLMASYRISGLPVVNSESTLVGLVTEHDLIAKTGARVVDIMSRSVISISPEIEVEEVAHVLTNQHIRRVPVLENGRLIGILSRSDLVRQIAMRWVCDVCGNIERNTNPPNQCSSCGAAQNAFTQRIVPPGM